jgi:DNA helicase HerA-like ATPase
MHWRDFLPAPDERLFVCGMTGSGKTTFVWQLINELPKNELVIIFDDKALWPIRKNKKQKDLPVLMKAWHIRALQVGMLKKQHYVYRPSYPEMADSNVNKILMKCFKMGHCTIIFDEIGDYGRGGHVMPIVGKLIRQGRQKKIRLMMGNQRPAAIPRIILSESSKFACFGLQLEDDRKRMARDVNAAMLTEALDHDFYWYDIKKRKNGAILVKATKEGVKA